MEGTNSFPIPTRKALGVHVRRRVIVYSPSCSRIRSDNSRKCVLFFGLCPTCTYASDCQRVLVNCNSFSLVSDELKNRWYRISENRICHSFEVLLIGQLTPEKSLPAIWTSMSFWGPLRDLLLWLNLQSIYNNQLLVQCTLYGQLINAVCSCNMSAMPLRGGDSTDPFRGRSFYMNLPRRVTFHLDGRIWRDSPKIYNF